MAQQSRRPQQRTPAAQSQASTSRKSSVRSEQSEPADLLEAVGPTFQEAKRYLEKNPVQAAAIGAVAGGLLMSLFASEKGRALVRTAYDYANPMVSKYARQYVSQLAGDAAEKAVSAH